MTYSRAAWIFLRLLGLVYLVAFWSLGMQIRGLVGHDGILPAAELMRAATRWAETQGVGLMGRFMALPTLCWFGAGDRLLEMLCAAGAGLAFLLVFGVAPALLLPLLWLVYLSLSTVCREFLAFQWDGLLLETGVLAVFMAPLAWFDAIRRPVDPSPVARWLLWWLLFRLMFGSGVVKLASGDPLWRHLTALTVHYETQPIPTPLGWYADHLPAAFQKLSAVCVLGLELVVPFGMFGPRRCRLAACGLLVGLQALIALTGNYAFFNMLTAALCVLLLDDEVFRALGDSRPREIPPARSARWPVWVPSVAALLIVPVSSAMLAGELRIGLPGSDQIARLEALMAPWQSVNAYGLFAVMTTTRPEIIVEGSDDAQQWRPYEFKYKVGDLSRRPPWVAPYQPRLDWQMWFAALDRYESVPWFASFLQRLLEGSPSVLALLARNPFPEKPPRFVRAMMYRYRMADWTEQRRDGRWWVREVLGPYSPVLSINAAR